MGLIKYLFKVLNFIVIVWMGPKVLGIQRDSNNIVQGICCHFSLYSFYEHILHRLVYKAAQTFLPDNITDGEIMVKENYFLLLTQLQENYFREEI